MDSGRALPVPKILVIDDSLLERRVLRRYLEEGGFEVEDWLPLSALEVADHVTASAPALVLSDFQMPGVNGLTVAKMVQKAAPDTPVVILSSFLDPDVEEKLRKFGTKRCIHKPVSGQNLVKILRELLGEGT